MTINERFRVLRRDLMELDTRYDRANKEYADLKRLSRRVLKNVLKIAPEEVEKIIGNDTTLMQAAEIIDIIWAARNYKRMESLIMDQPQYMMFEVLRKKISGLTLSATEGAIVSKSPASLEIESYIGNPIIETIPMGVSGKKHLRKNGKLYIDSTEGLTPIKERFALFFYQPEMQTLYKEGTMAWQFRMSKVITRWNDVNPTCAIHPYVEGNGKNRVRAWQVYYSLTRQEDFKNIFGIDPEHTYLTRPSDNGEGAGNKITPSDASSGKNDDLEATLLDTEGHTQILSASTGRKTEIEILDGGVSSIRVGSTIEGKNNEHGHIHLGWVSAVKESSSDISDSQEKKRKSKFKHLPLEALDSIKTAFHIFFSTKEMQDIYHEGTMPWQMRMSKVITRWNHAHPDRAIRTYQEGTGTNRKKAWHVYYNILSITDFEKVFGINPNEQYKIHPTLGEKNLGDNMIKTAPAEKSEKPVDQEEVIFTPSFPSSSNERKLEAIKLAEQAVKELEGKFQSYIQKKGMQGSLEKIIFDHSFETFSINDGIYEISMGMNVSGRNMLEKSFYEIYTSNGFTSYLKANGWGRNDTSGIWFQKSTGTRFKIVITPPTPRKNIEKSEKTEEDIVIKLSQAATTMQGKVLSFIRSYIRHKNPRFQGKYEVGTIIPIPDFPVSDIQTRYDPHEKIIYNYLAHNLPRHLYDALQDRDALEPILKLNPGVSIENGAFGNIFIVSDHDGFTLRFYTFVREEDKKRYG